MPYLGPTYCEVPPGYLKQMALHRRFPLLYWRPEPDPRSYVLVTLWVDTSSFMDAMRGVKDAFADIGERIRIGMGALGTSAVDIVRGGMEVA